nr:SDR family oxidoreductase [Thiocapsa sp. KS1]
MAPTPAPAHAVLISGASSGIGRACALDLAAGGFRVFAGVRRETDAESLRRAGGDRLHPVMLDVTCEQDILKALGDIRQALDAGERFALVNNAGVALSGPLEATSSEALRDLFEVNVVGVLSLTRAALPLLRERRGRIVNIGSTSGRFASALLGPYCASKFALEALTTSLRLELGETGIRVSMIEPGVVATPFWDKMRSAEQRLLLEMPEALRAGYADRMAARHVLIERLGRSGMAPEEVALAVRHALSAKRPRKRYVVGLRDQVRAAVAARLPDGLRGAIATLRGRGSGSPRR